MTDRTAATAIAGLAAVGCFSIGILTGISMRPTPEGEVTCLGRVISVKNVHFMNVAYSQADAGDLYAAMADALCHRKFRITMSIGK